MSVETLSPAPANLDLPPPPPEGSEPVADSTSPTPEFKPFHHMSQEEFDRYVTAKYGDRPEAQPAERSQEQTPLRDPEAERQKGIAWAVEQGMFSKARELAGNAPGSERSRLLEEINHAERLARLQEAFEPAPQAAPRQTPDVSNDATAKLYTHQDLEAYTAAQDPAETTEALEEIAKLDNSLADEAWPDDEDIGLELLGFGPKPQRERVEARNQNNKPSINLSAKAHAAWQKARKALAATGGDVALAVTEAQIPARLRDATAATAEFASRAGAKGREALRKSGEAGSKAWNKLMEIASIIGSAVIAGVGAGEKHNPLGENPTTFSPEQAAWANAVHIHILDWFNYGRKTDDPELVTKSLNAAHGLAIKTRQFDPNSYAKYDQLLQLALEDYPGEHEAFLHRAAHFGRALKSGDRRLQDRIFQDALTASDKTNLYHEAETLMAWRNHQYRNTVLSDAMRVSK